MSNQFGRAPFATPLVPDFSNGAAAAKTLLQDPHNVRSDGALRRSLLGSWFPPPSSVGRRYFLAMAEDAAGATLLFAAAWGNLPEILTVENGGPRPVEPGKAPSTTLAPETFSVTV